MATFPPPYSARDQVRQQMRAQRDAYRAQRDYWRMQRRPSIIRPLILITIGIVALLLESGKLSSVAFWEWYEQWWPALLIVLGVLSLGEWWLERDKPYGSRRIGGGIIFLIVVLAIIGSASNHLTHSHGWQWFQTHSDDGDMAWHWFGQEHDADVTLQEAVPANAAVRIKDPHGDVTVAVSMDGLVHVTSHDVVYSPSDKDANQKLGRVAPRLTVNGSDVLVETPDLDAAHTDLTVDLPASASLDIYAGHGDVEVNGTKGSVKVTSGRGDVKLDEIGGAIDAHMSQGDFSAHTIGGGVNIDGRMDDVSLNGIKGNVSLNGDFFGDMHLAALSAPLYLHSSRTEISMASVPGNLTLDSGDLDFTNVQGPVRVVTRSKDVEGTTIHGPTHIENSNGDVTLNVSAPLGEINIHNENGAVDLTLPPKTGFNLDATANDGELANDFDVAARDNDGKKTATGTVGSGGPKISVVSDHGDVHIKKAGSVAASSDDAEAPERPERPEKPEAPDKSVRHLHSSTVEPKPAVQ